MCLQSNKHLLDIAVNLTDIVIAFGKGDIVTVKSLLSIPASIRELFFTNKFLAFLDGVNAQDDKNATKLANMLRKNDDTLNENAFRLFHIIDSFETKKVGCSQQ